MGSAGFGAYVGALFDDSVKSGPIDHQVLDDRKSFGPPGLDGDGGPILKAPHVELAGGHMIMRAMGTSINEDAALATNAFPTIIFKGDHLFVAQHQLLIQMIQRLQKGHVGIESFDGIFVEAALGCCVGLSPDSESNVHKAIICSFSR